MYLVRRKPSTGGCSPDALIVAQDDAGHARWLDSHPAAQRDRPTMGEDAGSKSTAELLEEVLHHAYSHAHILRRYDAVWRPVGRPETPTRPTPTRQQGPHE